jgi:dihydroorotase
MHALPELSPEQIAELLSQRARRIFGLPVSRLKTGETADLTIFHPGKSSTFTKEDNKSKASNSPYFDKKLKGKVLATVSCNQIHKN